MPPFMTCMKEGTSVPQLILNRFISNGFLSGAWELCLFKGFENFDLLATNRLQDFLTQFT